MHFRQPSVEPLVPLAHHAQMGRLEPNIDNRGSELRLSGCRIRVPEEVDHSQHVSHVFLRICLHATRYHVVGS